MLRLRLADPRGGRFLPGAPSFGSGPAVKNTPTLHLRLAAPKRGAWFTLV